MAQDGTQQFPFLGSLPQQLPTGKKKKKKKSKIKEMSATLSKKGFFYLSFSFLRKKIRRRTK